MILVTIVYPSAQHLITNLQTDLKDKVKIFEDGQSLIIDKVYFVFIK